MLWEPVVHRNKGEPRAELWNGWRRVWGKLLWVLRGQSLEVGAGGVPELHQREGFGV